jgi:hypothetical protein
MPPYPVPDFCLIWELKKDWSNVDLIPCLSKKLHFVFNTFFLCVLFVLSEAGDSIKFSFAAKSQRAQRTASCLLAFNTCFSLRTQCLCGEISFSLAPSIP